MNARLLPGKPAAANRDAFWGIWAVASAFGTYFCMYAFRKPFTAAAFEGTSVGDVDFKVVAVIAQVLGYMLSKFLGIKVIAEMGHSRRAVGIAALIGGAEISLLAFGLVPRPWNAACLFCNGLALGMVFGLVLGFLEGRRLTEALTAGLCVSFILADGVMKSVGAWLLEQGVSEDWMPGTAGLLFIVPVGVCIAMLARIPPPSLEDETARTARFTLDRSQRWSLFGRHAAGLIPLIAMYLMISILRGVRADFAPELWRGLDTSVQPTIYARSELCVALGVVAVNGFAVVVRDNRRAFLLSLVTCGAGLGLLAATLIIWQGGSLHGFSFMVLVGLGLYLPYVAMHTTVFERLLAMTRDRGNIGFLLYVADSIGYFGYVAVMLVKNLGTPRIDIVSFFVYACWLSIGISACCLWQTWHYLSENTRLALSTQDEQETP